MASTYSPLLRIELMGTGDQANTWGVTTNENLGSLIEQAIAGAVTVNIPNSNVTLTELNGLPDQSRNMILVATGTLTAVRTIVAPETSKMYIVRNSTTGGFAINVQAGAGNSVTIPNGKTAIIYSDGVDFNSAVSYLLNAAIVGGTVTGLDTPLAITDGGTGANNIITARTNIEAAKSGVNSDITGLAALITPINVTQGGTGASNANSARANLQAARSGANSDITSLTGLTTPLTPAQGGTGASSIGSAGAIMYSNGTNQVASNVGTAGQLATSDGVGGVSFQSQVASIVYVIDGGGAIYSNGVKGFLQIPFNCTITAVSLLADQTGSTVIDIWKDTYANFPPTVADSICASALPTIPLSATKSVDITLTGWTTTITAGDVLAFNVVSVTSITRVTITLSVNRT
jgi:hypothetical protein